MSAQHPSPLAALTRRPRPTDARLVVGVLLVLASVVAGSRVVAGAERSQPVWAAARSLAAGSTLRADDVVTADVRLQGAAAAYLPVTEGGAPVGRVLTRAVVAGELLPAGALAATTGSQPHREVTLSVDPLHAPPSLDRGSLVDIYVTPGDVAASSAATTGASSEPVRALAGAVVVDVERDAGRLGSGSADLGVVVSVADTDVAALVAALHHGPVDLVGVVPG